ncbi:hypothetical protein JIN84_10200 [Luteolibacter yonseiensis]|uniref:Uncharacterized protein n=1 Tax=Luteolibacter yonseiensis TaxID=1144680 RepID=A0A934R487_9BACT|nr:hypothetical protein [Luteolibacter yonseiensis]MBK1815986.1 hypothetical protein [Luteolibacter yonseiensis]
MNSNSIANHFARMGARFRTVQPEPTRFRQRTLDYTLDLAHDKRGQIFELRGETDRLAGLDVQVLQCGKAERHLLLLVKTGETKDRFLCGHDEREWFVAAIPGNASNIVQAKLALQPPGVRHAAIQAGLGPRERIRRHNRAFLRQGEWFFVPAPGLHVDSRLILKNEPIRRGAGKPHMVAEVFRSGGESILICHKHPNGVSETEYKKILANTPGAGRWGWERRVRNAGVFARGAVKHRDHATLTLHDWHQVLMNTESSTRQMANVAFID